MSFNSSRWPNRLIRGCLDRPLTRATPAPAYVFGLFESSKTWQGGWHARCHVRRRVLGVNRATVIEEIDLDKESETVVVHVRPTACDQTPVWTVRGAGSRL